MNAALSTPPNATVILKVDKTMALKGDAVSVLQQEIVKRGRHLLSLPKDMWSSTSKYSVVLVHSIPTHEERTDQPDVLILNKIME